MASFTDESKNVYSVFCLTRMWESDSGYKLSDWRFYSNESEKASAEKSLKQACKRFNTNSYDVMYGSCRFEDMPKVVEMMERA